MRIIFRFLNSTLFIEVVSSGHNMYQFNMIDSQFNLFNDKLVYSLFYRSEFQINHLLNQSFDTLYALFIKGPKYSINY